MMGNEKADVLSGASEVKCDLIIHPLAVKDAMQDMTSLSATRVEEDSHMLRHLIEKNVARGDDCQGNQLLMETISI